MVLQAAISALQCEAPEEYCRKCHGATLTLFMILRSLRIRALIHGGTVSFQFGGTDAGGRNWQERCGFWTPNPDLPSPHAWLITEFGELVDLSCSFFSILYQREHSAQKALDAIPMIWAPVEHLRALPTLTYAPALRFGDVDLASCDELARRTVATALAHFWGGSPWRNQSQVDGSGDSTLIDGMASIAELRNSNAWIARNSVATLINSFAANGAAASLSPPQSC